MTPSDKATRKKHIEQMSADEVVERFKKTGGMTVPFYMWRYDRLRSKLNALVRKGVLRKKRHKGYEEFILPA